MNTSNQVLQNCLRCLQHPLALACIALLLLNDHVFKVLYPSWLTGKLSDVAGLFFFPFIVAAILGGTFAKFMLNPNHVGRLAFGSVAVWFTLIKTLPAANDIMNHLLSGLLGYSVRLVIDPSDLIGLIALWPAWKLWQQRSHIKSQKISYAPLVLGLIACLATSPAAPTVEVVTHLVEKDGSIFALDSTNGMMAISRNGGQAWEWSDRYDEVAIPSQLKSPPVTACLPEDSQQCYRVNRERIVEESQDGGQSWSISWQLPADRFTYMERIDPDIDLGPYDILIVQWQSQTYILVAAGEEGILRKEPPDGQWGRVAVENAIPTPIKSATLSNAISTIWGELLIWFLLSIIMFSFACWIVWSENSKLSGQQLSQAVWIVFPALSPIVGILLSLLAILGLSVLFYMVSNLLQFDDRSQGILLIVFILCVGAALLLLPWIIYRALNKWKMILIQHHYPADIAHQLVWTAYFSHVSVFAAGLVAWFCWTMDIISAYGVALVSGLVLTGWITVFFLRRVKEFSHQHISALKD